jgi:hypothetical protein
MDDGFEVGLDRGVANRKHVGHGHRPAVAELCAQRQALPGDAPGPRYRRGDAMNQRFMGIAPGAVALQRL